MDLSSFRPVHARPSLTPFRRVCLILTFAGGGVCQAASGPLSFNKDIRPILSDKCFACHGTDTHARKADLRLDTPAGAYAEIDGGVAITPGDPARSGVWKRIMSDDPDEVMPPPKSHKTLTPEEKETIRRWIEQGAVYQKHWSLEPPMKGSLPAVLPEAPAGESTPVRTPVDAFWLARLTQEKLTPSPEADRPTLIRRVTLALTGLPPSLEETEAFVKDLAPQAYEKVVDRLLASPRFGEHMAHWWLDLARYADTHGLHLDNERQTWLYRDWVVNAFNRNLPFDQFTIEQLAGDLLPDPSQDQLVATGFVRANVTTGEGGAINQEWLFRYAVDRTSTATQTWLALTTQCAACHDHKFDPISQKEFYGMYAFFNNNADPAMDGNALLTAPVVKYYTPPQQNTKEEWNGKIRAAEAIGEDDLTVFTAAYRDPAEAATGEPVPPPREVEDIWMDDSFAAGGKITGKPSFVGKPEIEPASGERAFKQTSKGLGQVVWETTAPAWVPQQAVISAQVRLDPTNPPKSIMLQFHTRGQWRHRAVWGDINAIEWGTPGTVDRFHAGPLPAAGAWVKLEIPTSQLGLEAGEGITGVALTQFDGTVYWDRLAMRGIADPVNDPSFSLRIWHHRQAGQEIPNAPAEVNAALKKKPEECTADERTLLRRYYLATANRWMRDSLTGSNESVTAARQQLAAFEQTVPASFIMRDLEQPRDSFVMLRGQYDAPGEKVMPSTPAALPALKKRPDKDRADRLDFARWIMAPENPLTARVAVNRFWQHLFGTGLVRTSADFGSQGQTPSHPELLDWLAVSFREQGWDMKWLMKTLVTSSVWRQSSKLFPELLERDPGNRLLARAPRPRLNAEAIRDSALYASGLLVERQGGRGVRTYQPANIWEPVGYSDSNTRYYKRDDGESLYRRSLYTFWKRTAPAPFLVNFDAPAREEFCTKRDRGNTPTQAMQLLNDVQYFEAARLLAQRLLAHPGTAGERINLAYQIVLSRPPEPMETERVIDLLEHFLTLYRADPASAGAVLTNGESKAPVTADPAELASWTQLGNLLLNLDETVTIN